MAKSVKVGGRKLSEFSDIVKQIDRDLHPDLIPSKTAAGSGKRVNWKCPDCNHKWNTKIADRTVYQTGCPKCSYSERADKRARVDEKESIQEIIKLTKDCSGLVRACAYGALGHLKAREGIKELHEGIFDSNVEAVKSAAYALSRIREKILQKEIEKLQSFDDQDFEKILKLFN